MTRAWPNRLRDRLTIEVAAHFAAQRPGLLRAVLYESWDPSRVPGSSAAGDGSAGVASAVGRYVQLGQTVGMPITGTPQRRPITAHRPLPAQARGPI